MEAVIFLSSVTFVIVVTAAIIRGRYRVRLQVTSKEMSPSQSLDLERFDPEGSAPVQPPQLHHHSRLGSRNSRWPGYTDRRTQPSRTMVDHFASYRIPEEADTTIHHFPQAHSPRNLPATFMAPAAHATTPPPATALTPPEAPTLNPS
ncbi:uncharacterized protein N7487_006504 [Penicillium crustosum]|uniref:uncharacterized protein n=1 Tax=Penicillium crustosum TaxID=36656 RepID=UPI00238E6AFD|nr:uncharacterized protein N7487_006504 [Penicillium crustosum]KAJ5412145.1 hypothetical protein N7487_006504 [Penicillium crustosum]